MPIFKKRLSNNIFEKQSRALSFENIFFEIFVNKIILILSNSTVTTDTVTVYAVFFEGLIFRG